jgi:hypothetical protein
MFELALFMSLERCAPKCEAWRHSAIGNKTLVELIGRSAAHGPR